MNVDFVVIGAGISGAAAACELAASGTVALLEAESRPGYHSTGRSAAMYTPNYGPELVCSINRLSHDFLLSPPEDFTDHALLKPRGMFTVVPKSQADNFDSLVLQGGMDVEALDSRQTIELAPFLREDRIVGSIYEKGVADMDVDALHQGFLKLFRNRGGVLYTDSPVMSLSRTGEAWEIKAGNITLSCGVVVNAAGAWADKVGAMAGASAIGLTPKRRTAILVDAPAGIDLNGVPLMDFAGVGNYIKPEATQLMVSPGDANPVEPQDIQPDDMDVAVLVDWLENETSIVVNRVSHQWAGLRSFVADGCPVAGFDPTADGFFWLAGQGGYGIMMSSALGRATASLVTSAQLPEDFIAAGVSEAKLGVNRLLG